MPVSMRDWVDEQHLVWFVLEVVQRMDTSGLHRRPGGCPGRPPYQPEMLLAVLLYAYCCGVRSSRQIEAQCRTDAPYRVICGCLEPDHTTIARFVVDHEQALENLFVDGLRLCAAAGLADLSVLALDGTKIAADASIARNRDAQWIRREIAKLMAVTATDEGPAAADGVPGIEAVGEISSPSPRLARLQAAQAVIDAEDAAAAAEMAARAQAAAAQAEHGRKLAGRKPKDPHAALARAKVDHRVALERLEQMHAARAAKLAALAPGQNPKGPPYPSEIKRAQTALARAETTLAAAQQALKDAQPPTRRVNITDPDSRIMSTKNGWVQGYNCQAIVNHKIVLAIDVSQDVSDVQLFEPMNDTLATTLSAAGITAQVELELADAGYCSEHNLTCPGVDRLIATTKDHKQRAAARELGLADGPPPPDADPVEQMEHLLRTPQGTAAYKQRSQMIEHVFGDRKHNRQIRRFRRRGLDAVRSEWAFANLAGNILTLYRHHTTPAIA